MTSYPRNQCNISNGPNKRTEKTPKSLNYQVPLVPSKGDCLNDLLYNDKCYDYWTDTNEKGSDDSHSNDSLSFDDTNTNATGTGDIEYYRALAASLKRDKLTQDSVHSSYLNNKRTSTLTTENFDDLLLRLSSQRKVYDYNIKKDMNRSAYEPINPNTNEPQEMLAIQKLQKLKELQRRRDYTERYYSQQIRRLIGDHCTETKTSSANSKYQEQALPKLAGDRVPLTPQDNVEPCGTLTTITKLDCGCMEQMSRPIFTTTSGRVMTRRCDQGQQVHIRLSTPNARLFFGGHSPSALPTHHQHQHQHQPPMAKLRSKSFIDPRSCHGSAAATRTGQDAQDRSNSPARKPSETSVFSA